jgi:outer membrane protein assembly factor BamB
MADQRMIRRGALRAGVPLILALFGCGKTKVAPPTLPFPPSSRWEMPREIAASGSPATDGNLVFSSLSDGSIQAVDPADGKVVWTRPGAQSGILAARPSLLVFVEKGGVVWGIRGEDGGAQWKTATEVTGVQSVHLDGNRVFLGGASGFASVIVSTGELRYDLPATNVRDIDAEGDLLALIENGDLLVRERETGTVRYRLASPEGSFGSPAIFSDGRLVVGSGNRLVRGISSDGGFTWRFKVGATVRNRPLDFGDRKRVGVVSYEGVFYELSLGGGDMRRRTPLASRPFGDPRLASGYIWTTVYEDEVAAIDPRTGKIVGKTRFGGSLLSNPIQVRGRLVAEVSGPRRLVGIGLAGIN